MLEGKVKFFNKGEKYGFLKVRGGDDVCIHLSKGYHVDHTDSGLAWTKKKLWKPPEKNQVLVFELEEHPKGVRARRWGFKDPLDAISEGRPNVRRFA